MKKITTVFLLASLLFATGCGSSSSTPEEVAEMFAMAMAEHDWETAKKVSTKETHQMIETMKQFAAAGASPREIVCENMNCEVDGNRTVCTYQVNGNTENLMLVKENDLWLVEEKKEMDI